MSESALAVAPAASRPPSEVKIAVLLQAILFLRGLGFFIVAYTFLGKGRIHPLAAVLLFLILAGISSLWICGLWWRRNWVRWLTVIWDIFLVCNALRTDIANDRGPESLGYFLVAIQVAVTVMLLRPVASHWYGRKAGELRRGQTFCDASDCYREAPHHLNWRLMAGLNRPGFPGGSIT